MEDLKLLNDRPIQRLGFTNDPAIPGKIDLTKRKNLTLQMR